MQPNVLLIVVDALRARNTSLYGCPKHTTPFLEELRKDSTLFLNAYSCANHTDPSFTTIMSGRYPLSHGIIHHGSDIQPQELAQLDATKTRFIQEILRVKGYYTTAIDWLGRWHKRGFMRYIDPLDFKARKRSLFRPLAKVVSKVLPKEIYSNLFKLGNKLGLSSELKDATKTTDLAIQEIEHAMENKKSFFILIHYWDVHTPFIFLPKEYKEKFKRKGKTPIEDILKNSKNEKWQEVAKNYHLLGIEYAEEVEDYYNGAIAYVDTNIERLVQFLKEKDIYENTIIVITGDHGDNLIRNNEFIGHIGLYEDTIKVPLLIKDHESGILTSNEKISELVQHVDIVPTLIKSLGIPLHLMEADGDVLPYYDREYITAMEAAANFRIAISNRQYKFIYSPTREDAITKYGLSFRDVEELYDLQSDPQEENNIYREKEDVSDDLENKLIEWILKYDKRDTLQDKDNEKAQKRLRELGYV